MALTILRPDELSEMCFGNSQPFFLQLRTVRMIAVDRIVPAFDVEIGIVSDPDERVDDLRPVRVTQPGKRCSATPGWQMPYCESSARSMQASLA